MEVWKEIPNTNGKIFISNCGRVKSTLRGDDRILAAQPDTKGYHRVSITVDRVKRCYKVHREVAKAFIPNPLNLPQVNHIDGNKDNNSVDNLEWVTSQQNALHARATGLWDTNIAAAKKASKAKRKPIVGKCGSDIRHFKSICEAQAFIGSRHIVDVLKGRRTNVKGWTFAYEGK